MGAGNPKEGFGTAFSSLVNRMEAFVQPIEFVDRMKARTACRILSIRRKAFRQQPIEYCIFERKAFGQPFRRILDRRKARTAYRFLSIERRLFGTVFSSIDKGIQEGVERKAVVQPIEDCRGFRKEGLFVRPFEDCQRFLRWW